EAISASLATRRSLQIISPSATIRDAASQGDLRRAAAGLGSKLFLTGTLRRMGAQLRLTYSLVDAVSGAQLAAETLNGSGDDLFELEDALIACVDRALGITSSVSHSATQPE